MIDLGQDSFLYHLGQISSTLMSTQKGAELDNDSTAGLPTGDQWYSESGMSDRPSDGCGVFGIFGSDEPVASLAFAGLCALQHRGQESAGMVTSDGVKLYEHRQMGQVVQAFDQRILASMKGFSAIGHTRYSTTGTSTIDNAQPLVVEGTLGWFAIAHNGNLTNTLALRKQWLAEGERLQTTSDTEMIARLLATAPGRDYQEKIRWMMPRLQGAYSLVVLTPTSLIGIRDPHGIRPLSLGRLKNQWVIASETCAIEAAGGTTVRDIHPGEVVLIEAGGEDGLAAFVGQLPKRLALCLFEYIYFARPESVLNGRLIHTARQQMGAALAAEFSVDADVVIGSPTSALPAAVGYATARSLPYADGLIVNQSVGRTFIQPNQSLRSLGVSKKFTAVPVHIRGKRVVLIEDSIVRGTTIQALVVLLREAGATQVHVGVSSPPLLFPCYLGIDLARKEDLLAARHPHLAAIAREVGADSLHYLSLGGLLRAIDLSRSLLCTGCFTGRYPLPTPRDRTVVPAPSPASGDMHAL